MTLHSKELFYDWALSKVSPRILINKFRSNMLKKNILTRNPTVLTSSYSPKISANDTANSVNKKASPPAAHKDKFIDKMSKKKMLANGRMSMKHSLIRSITKVSLSIILSD